MGEFMFDVFLHKPYFTLLLTFREECFRISSLMERLILYFILAINLGLVVWLIILTKKYSAIMSKAEILFADQTPGNLLEVVKKYLKNVKDVEDHCYSLDKDLKKIAKIAEKGLFKTGFIRYNPFGDVGGNQSFSVSLLDNENSGYVISSIHSREGTRVYAKKIDKGDSDYNLSEEEKKAISLAIK